MNEIKIIKADKIELRHGDDGTQFLVVPAGFELPEGEVTIRKEGNRLVIEPAVPEKTGPKTWAEFFENLEPVDVEWPDVDEGLLPLDDINL